MLLQYADLVDATAEVAGGEKVWHSINRLILSDLMLLYAVGQNYLVDATTEVARKSGTL